ncbi:hypothetical protein GCM10028808_18840 [Spirosoma migulaei]
MEVTPGRLAVSVPEIALVRLTTTETEYVLVAVAQSPAVATALIEQTGATEQEAGAV